MYKSILTAVLALALTWGCAKQVAQQESNTLPASIETIAVLPVETIETGEEVNSPQTTKQMQDGIESLSQVLSDYFTDNPKVRMLSNEEVDSYVTSYNANRLDQALSIGKALKAEAVMLWSLKRFDERSGRDYAAQAPASVAFDYRLVHTESGQTLCSGSFDKTQESILENLLSLKNLANRGFRWITAAELAREGVDKELPGCKYLK